MIKKEYMVKEVTALNFHQNVTDRQKHSLNFQLFNTFLPGKMMASTPD